MNNLSNILHCIVTRTKYLQFEKLHQIAQPRTNSLDGQQSKAEFCQSKNAQLGSTKLNFKKPHVTANCYH